MTFSRPAFFSKPFNWHGVRLTVIILAIIGVFLGLLALGILSRLQAHHERVSVSQNGPIAVYTTTPTLHSHLPPVDLPGEVRPYLVSALYSRVSGILKARYVDYGSHVQAGQILGVVDVPDLDQQLAQARAELQQAQQNLSQAEFNYNFASLTLERWRISGQGGALAQQDIDQRQNAFSVARASYWAARAAVKNSEANVRRLLALESYKTILAPFSGVISQRNVDPGANIVAGGSSTSTNLFTVEQINRLRIFINVPQAFVPAIKPGITARITIPELPNDVFEGRVLSSANALDPASRTLLTQIIVNNKGNKLYPGLYTRVSFNPVGVLPLMMIPDNTIVTANDGLKVVAVMPDHRLHYIPIQVGRDNGTTIEVRSGLTGHEKLVKNPLDTLKEGQPVKIDSSS